MTTQPQSNNTSIAIIGLGYVGLPLAAEFGKHFPTVGFDINQQRIDELRRGYDRTRELESTDLQAAEHLRYASKLEDIARCTVYIVTVPTPIDDHKKPDLRPLLAASASVGKVLKPGDLVIYESTVYPGCTEDDCVPILEQHSGLSFNQDFFCGYSPERINPGDKQHTVTNILKVTSGSTPEVAERVDTLYRQIITAGTYKAGSIKVAEAAKVIENAQRDINIAFVNELALIFDRMGIDTIEVLEAAGTKWNFLPFRPGLVGGHCIGVDPYYLTYKAESIGYHPHMILAGRRINDGMGSYVAGRVVKIMIKKGLAIVGAKVLMMGITFKENCPDIRNSRVIDIIKEMQDYGCAIEIFDPWADSDEVRHEYNVELVSEQQMQSQGYQAVIVAVAHQEFVSLNPRDLVGDGGVVYDIKGMYDKHLTDGRL
ncbi:Vi polysaccharide biosynthesis UDP-N-acetylglucosamine C-6 dehydrogenase TviB [Pelovirga terrestris]|uniref:Vi polysaccharide biosynthesis UDP-N-acetylglucosamine C-6 dehydrogenase TviB n=1 Tax=Pelovirga terrestris TaxID=2771352 RepID=A0A8J6UNJ2_9BACT|nr:Vi polysaccharide biosynthesis UDP-N-acetylglucosamine C-6 dehydrogenase TviB [Pelovirga terrestris]MBD1399614.1 Vi polysaccharide biosynthesis UDP-N-acetylglucosamine C-6 dehydrogenase TviB [Pelovirga terrestris]